MPKLYYLGALLLLTGRVAAQAPTPTPGVPVRTAPTSFKNGSYQLASGEWKHGKLLYDERTLNVSDADHKPKEPLALPAGELRAFAIGRDTFEVVHEVDIPKPAQHLSSTFARHLYRSAGFQVAEFVSYLTPPEPPISYTMLLRPGQPTVVLSNNNVQFRLALAKVLSDYKALAQQLELDPNVLPQQLPELLTAYARWKASVGTAAK